MRSVGDSEERWTGLVMDHLSGKCWVCGGLWWDQGVSDGEVCVSSSVTVTGSSRPGLL
jgi:hypothetical protein